MWRTYRSGKKADWMSGGGGMVGIDGWRVQQVASVVILRKLPFSMCHGVREPGSECDCAFALFVNELIKRFSFHRARVLMSLSLVTSTQNKMFNLFLKYLVHLYMGWPTDLFKCILPVVWPFIPSPGLACAPSCSLVFNFLLFGKRHSLASICFWPLCDFWLKQGLSTAFDSLGLGHSAPGPLRCSFWLSAKQLRRSLLDTAAAYVVNRVWDGSRPGQEWCRGCPTPKQLFWLTSKRFVVLEAGYCWDSMVFFGSISHNSGESGLKIIRIQF